MPLVKGFPAIPHDLVLVVLGVAGVRTSIATWSAVVTTGRFPRSRFRFTVGVMRWHNRVVSYAFLLATDTYPPFRLDMGAHEKDPAVS